MLPPPKNGLPLGLPPSMSMLLHPLRTVFHIDFLHLEAYFSCTFLGVPRGETNVRFWGFFYSRRVLIVFYCLHRLPRKNECPLTLPPLLSQCYHVAISRFEALRRGRCGLRVVNSNFIWRFPVFCFNVIASRSECFRHLLLLRGALQLHIVGGSFSGQRGCAPKC